MSLEYMRENLDGLDDSVKGLYKEQDGKFSLDINLGDSFVASKDVAGLKANHDKLLAEKKEAQRLANETAAEAKRAKEEAALKNGDLESLTKSWQDKENEYKQKLDSYAAKEANNAISKASLDAALTMSEGANAKILSRFFADRLKYDGGEVKVTDNSGNLTVSTIEDLRKEFENNADYASLITGSKAAGSGATKSNTGGASKNTISRSEFDAMSHRDRAEFFKTGGAIAD